MQSSLRFLCATWY